MVRIGVRNPGDGHVGIADGLHLGALVVGDERVKVTEHMVKHVDQGRVRYPFGEVSEVDDVGELDALLDAGQEEGLIEEEDRKHIEELLCNHT